MYFRRIGDLRIDKDIKQAVLANYFGVKQNTYSDYENGKINVPIEIMMKLADDYGVSLDYLTGRTDEK